MQRQQRRAHAALCERRHQLGCKMERCRGCRNRPFLLGEERLVIHQIALVGDAAANIGRQRDGAMAMECLEKHGTLAVEAQHDLAVILLGQHIGREILGELNAVAGPEAFRRLGEDAPDTVLERLMQRHRDLRVAAPAREPRRYHARIVEDEAIARLEQARQMPHRLIFEPVLRHAQQPRRIARLDRALGDQMGRQLEIEFVDTHEEQKGRLSNPSPAWRERE